MVVTDHQALFWFANLEERPGHFRRWCLRLGELDFASVSKSRRKYSAADCLSRAPVVSSPQDSNKIATFFSHRDAKRPSRSGSCQHQILSHDRRSQWTEPRLADAL